jgi:pyruvate dehydrogenase (quinone)
MLGNEAGYHALLSCDAWLPLGADFAWRQFPTKQRLCRSILTPPISGHPVTKGVAGDVKATLEAFAPQAERPRRCLLLGRLVKRYAKARESERTKAVAGRDGGIPGTYLTEVINRHAAKDALLRHTTARRPHGLYSWSLYGRSEIAQNVGSNSLRQ